MEFASEHWGKLLLASCFLTWLYRKVMPRRHTTATQAIENMAETRRLIEFLKTCSEDEAIARKEEVVALVSNLSPVEHNEIIWALTQIRRGGRAGELLRWVVNESTTRFDSA